MPAVQPRPTLADVARLAGVSAKTVSRVYADPDTVSPQTAAKVRAAAERLNFRPNLLARDLRRGGVSQTVAFVTSEF
ncbi:MAG: LacI family DNA-binding transcriptional regulator, partial [Propionicimonas sp.]|nr:LacI family DNA-binding transcriptional regulator [Propionicimonas sp.]